MNVEGVQDLDAVVVVAEIEVEPADERTVVKVYPKDEHEGL